MSDLVLHIDASNGLDNLRLSLSSFPFPIEMQTDSSTGECILVQSAVSDVAGFAHYGTQNGTQSYGVFVISTAQSDEDEVVSRISAAMRSAHLSHRIVRTYESIEDEDILVEYCADEDLSTSPQAAGDA